MIQEKFIRNLQLLGGWVPKSRFPIRIIVFDELELIIFVSQSLTLLTASLVYFCYWGWWWSITHVSSTPNFPGFNKVFQGQGLYEVIQISWGTKWIEYFYVSLNLFSATSHSHTGYDSSVTEMSLPCMLSAIYILHGKYLALINSHLKL